MRNRLLYRLVIIILMTSTMAGNLVMTVFLQRFFYGDLQVQDPSSLHRVASSLGRGYLGYKDYRDVVDSTTAFDGLSANFVERGVTVYHGEHPFWMDVSWTTGSFGAVIGRVPLAGGRFLEEMDDDPAAARVAVVSERVWSALSPVAFYEPGTRILVKGEFFEVIGVVRQDFPGLDYMEDVDIWIPALQNPMTWQFEVDDYQEYQVLARLAPARRVVAEQQLDAALDDIEDRLGFRYTADILTETEYRLKRRPMMHRLFVALSVVTGFLFVLGIVNQGLMLVTRSVALSHELKIMSALGARWRHVLRRFLHGFFILLGVSLLCVMALSIVVIHLYNLSWGQRYGAIPLAQLAGPAPLSVLSGMVSLLLLLHIGFPFLGYMTLGGNIFSRDRAAGSRWSAKSGLSVAGVICQVALVVVAILGCAAFLNTLVDKGSVSGGRHEDRMLHVEMVLAGRSMQDLSALQSRLAQVEAALYRLGGVESIGTSSTLPLHSGGWTRALVQGRPLEKDPDWITFAFTTPGYFEAIGLEFLRGRDFSREDALMYPPESYIINRAYAEREFPGMEAMGNFVSPWDNAGFGAVIGVVENQVQSVSGEEPPTIYVPNYLERFFLHLRLADPALVATGRQNILDTITATDAGAILLRTETIDSIWEEALASSRLGFMVLLGLSLAGLLLSLSGVYGYQSYTVSLREREFAIRNAIGATIPVLYRAELRRGLIIVAAGQVIGVAGFLVALRFFATSFFPLHLPVLNGVLLILILCAGFLGVVALASLPVRRPQLSVLMRE